MSWSRWLAISALVVLVAYATLLGFVEEIEAAMALGRPIQGPPDETAVAILGFKLFSDSAPTPLLHLRIAKAAEIVLSGASSTLVMSGAVPENTSRLSEAHSIRRHLLECYPEVAHRARLLLEENSWSTWDNAVQTIQLIRREAPAVKRVVVVTNPFHQPRAYLVFRRAARYLNDPIEVVCADTSPSFGAVGQGNAMSCPGRPFVDGQASATSTTSYHIENAPEAAFDTSVGSAWHSAEGLPVSLLYSFRTTSRVCGYVLRSRSEQCCHSSDAPSAWRLWARVDGEELLVHSVDDEPQWDRGERRAYALPPVESTAMRLEVLQVPGRGSGERFVVLAEVGYVGCDTPLEGLEETAMLSAGVDDALAKPSVKPNQETALTRLVYHAIDAIGPWRVHLAREIAREVVAFALYVVRGRLF